MGLFEMAEQALGGAGQGGNAALVGAVLSAVSNHPGGLGGLLQSFEQQGLGGAVSSWVGSGPNQPVSGQQVQSVLGNDAIAGIAAKLGISPAIASTAISAMLPGLIDHLTPGGQVPAAGSNILEMGESLLKGLMK